MAEKHFIKSIQSQIEIHGTPEKIWDQITKVRIEEFSDPIIFKLLDIPKPLRPEIISEGKGGKRIAYFSSGKRFLQEILVWRPFEEYSFSFNPEKGFRVCYIFELSAGIFRIPTGAYLIKRKGDSSSLSLVATYSIDKRLFFLLNLPVRLVLKIFQRYLLNSIKKNSQ